MIYLSFFLIMLGAAAFMVSLITVFYRIVNRGGWPKGDAAVNWLIKTGLAGLAMVLLGQLIVALAL
ncbi:putative membrane protein [Desulfohalotomaculum tongense]|uniref:hypothetical protein n=1 Tax=Desulforadius tongensis TaxID=1216062 RepID=UPI001956BBFB|nr:hypothetical protein [Desulforadius tongensis]MBM7856017.1 putative membrane protein [Desulforadius tongensis]